MRVDAIRRGGSGAPLALDLAFTDGRNLVLGGNGTGKTVAVRALALGFLGNGEAEAREAGWIEIAFTWEKRAYVLHRNLDDDHVRLARVDDGETVLFDGAPGENETDFRAAAGEALGRSRLTAWLRYGILADRAGLPDPDVFGEEDDDGDDADRALLRVLRRDLRELQGTGSSDEVAVQPGQLDIIEEEVQRKRRQLDTWSDRARQLGDAAGELTEAESRLEEAERAAEAREVVFDTLLRFRDLTEEYDQLSADLSELERERDEVKVQVEKVEKANKALESKYGEFMNAGSDLEDSLQSWTEAEARLHELERREHLTRQDLDAQPRTHTARNGGLMAAVLGTFGWFACLGAGVSSAGILVAPLCALVGYLAVWAKDRSVATLKRSRRQELAAIEEEKTEVTDEIQRWRRSLGDLGKLENPTHIRRMVVEYWKAREEVEKLRRGLDQKPTLRDAFDAYEAKLERRREVDREIGGLIAGAPYLDGLDADRRSLDGEVEMARAQREATLGLKSRLEKEAEARRTEAENRRNDTPPLSRLERELHELSWRRDELKRRADAAALAVEVAENVLSAYSERRERKLREWAGSFLLELTDGKYTAVRFNEHRRPEALRADGTWVPGDRLSRGLTAQLSLALDLAEVRRGGEWLPLLLDDPFAGWDAEPRAKALELLRRHADKGGQVILLARDEFDPGWAETRSELPEPGAESAAA